MIKKLKIRFVLVNMLILTFVLFATLSSIYAMMSNSEIKVSNEIMDTLIENHRKTIASGKKDPKNNPKLHTADSGNISSSEPDMNNLSWRDAGGIRLVRLADYEEVTEAAQENEELQINPWAVNPWENAWAAEWNPWANPWDQWAQWGQNNPDGSQGGNPWENPNGNQGENPNGNYWDNPGGSHDGNHEGNQGENQQGNPWDHPWNGNQGDNQNGNPWENPWGGQGGNQNGNQNENQNGNPWENPWENPWGSPEEGQGGNPWENQWGNQGENQQGNPWENPWNNPWMWGPWMPPADTPSVTEAPETGNAAPSQKPYVPEKAPDNDRPVSPSESYESTAPETEAETSGKTDKPEGGKKTESRHEEPPPEITTRYDGNLVRSHILADIGRGGMIHDLSLQYFFKYEDETIEDEEKFNEQVRSSIEKIIAENSTSGKCSIENVSYRFKVENAGPDNERILLLLDRSIEISTLHRLLITFIIIGCIGLIIVFFLSLFLASWAIKPIEVAWNRQKQFIADASHELKTPLTVISTNTDVVLSTPNDHIRDQERWLRYIKSETARMSKLVTELLYIAKSDSNEIRMEMSDFDISNAVSEVCLNFEAHAFEEQRELVADISPRLKYFGDEDRIKQLITILVDNAIKYSIIGSQISVSLFRNNQNRIKLCVSNKCENLTEENISKLFDRFYRVDSSRNSGTGGNGLGLNIAQAITEAHNGVINVNYNHGIISFTVTL